MSGLSITERDRVVAALRDEFGGWIDKHPLVGLFDWNVAAENVLRAAQPAGAVDRIKALRGNVEPPAEARDEREAAYSRGYLSAVADALERVAGGQSS